MPEPDAIDIGLEILPCVFLKKGTEIVWIDVDMVSQYRQSEFFGVMFLNVGFGFQKCGALAAFRLLLDALHTAFQNAAIRIQ